MHENKKRFSAAMLSVASLLLLSSLNAAAQDTTVARQRIRLDAGWRFHRGDISSTSNGTAVSNWHMQAAPSSGSDAASVTQATYDASRWAPAAVGADLFSGKPGSAWMRASLESSPLKSTSAPVLHFESVDDSAAVYFNGKLLLSHKGWDSPFDVPLAGAWQPSGPNVVTVLVQNTAGTGGIMGPVTLQNGQSPADIHPAQTGYNDRAWRKVHLPHDFVVEGPFTQKASVSHGSLATDVGWYRKALTIPASAKGRIVWLDFDGVYRDSQVWLNGKLLGRHASGYMGFRYDITKAARYGAVNMLAVRADARAQEGWWYEGGGIYRHVWLNIAAPLHVAPWGTSVASDVANLRGGHPSANLTLHTTLINQSSHHQSCVLLSQIIDPLGKTVGTAKMALTLSPFQSVDAAQRSAVPSAKLWSIEKPQLYHLRTQVIQSNLPIDSVDTTFGIRTIRFDADKGFFLNGKPVKIKGTCNHQDFAGVGIGVPDSLEYWRVAKLKAMGSNAWRMSHNPPNAELLDACDKLGMLVMDENRHLGDTFRAKTSPGTPYSDLSDLASMVRRDRNHPSIIMWSMCNEEGLQSSTEGARIFTAMKNVVQEYDTTRPISCAMNSGWGQGISLVEELFGGNYNPKGYDAYHLAHPAQPMYGSETASTVSTRGIYANDTTLGYVSAYDLNAPPWAQTTEVAWRALAERPYMAGGFVWTGFDYKGEPTPYGWPCINSHFGIMDMCGFPKDNYYYYLSWWGSKPVVHVYPHWNWAGKEGQPVDVWVDSNAEKVDLLLNGKSLGTKEMPHNGHLQWQVPYAPGTLVAQGYTAGKLIATDKVQTTGKPAALRLSTSRTMIKPDGEDVTMVAVSVIDTAGRIVPTASNDVQFTLSGPAHIAGVGNGDPSSHEPDQASQRRAFNGLCMVIVGANEKPGIVTLIATSPGLKSTRMQLKSQTGAR